MEDSGAKARKEGLLLGFSFGRFSVISVVMPARRSLNMGLGG